VAVKQVLRPGDKQDKCHITKGPSPRCHPHCVRHCRNHQQIWS